MPIQNYTYSISGYGADGETWETRGNLRCDLVDAFDDAMKEAFQMLTQGRAIYGNPGKGGCRGPYKIKRVVIQLEDDEGRKLS